MKKLIIILILFCSIQGFGQIKGYYRLNGNSNDASGNGNNGTDTNITYSQSNGILNQGTSYLQTTSLINLGTVSGVASVLANPYTISFWVRINTYKYHIFIERTTSASAGGYFGFSIGSGIYDTHGLTFILNKSQIADNVCKIDNILNTGLWYHVVMTYSGSVQKIYCNGVNVATTSRTAFTSAVTNSQVFTVGNFRGATYSGIYRLDGALDELIIDNTEWSPVKVKNEYLRVKGFFQN